MSEDKPIPLGVLLADYEAQLYTTLQQIQALPQNTVLHDEVETYVANLTRTVKLLRLLATQKWQPATVEENHTDSPNHCKKEQCIRTDNDRVIVTRMMLQCNMVGDIITLDKIQKPYKFHMLKNGTVAYEISLFDTTIFVKAKHLSLPQSLVKLTKVLLNDGNVAWLTPKTLEQIKSVLMNEARGHD